MPSLRLTLFWAEMGVLGIQRDTEQSCLMKGVCVRAHTHVCVCGCVLQGTGSKHSLMSHTGFDKMARRSFRWEMTNHSNRYYV